MEKSLPKNVEKYFMGNIRRNIFLLELFELSSLVGFPILAIFLITGDLTSNSETAISSLGLAEK